MAKKKKKEDSNAGLFLLIILLLGGVGFLYYYDTTNKKEREKANESVVKKEEKQYSDEEIEKIYRIVKLDLGYEGYKSNKEDISKIDGGISSSDISNELKIIYAMNNMNNSYINTDNTKRPNIGNYVYSGKNIKATNVNTIINRYLNTTCSHTSVITNSTYYYYDKNDGLYYLYKRDYKTNIKKETYKEAEWDDEYIYIHEYMAYTDTSKDPMTSYTNHNNLLPIDITEKNITENLDIIDHFKYTFKYNSSLDSYQLLKIEYIKPSV